MINFDPKSGEWTDDTSMALCLAENLIEHLAVDPVVDAVRAAADNTGCGLWRTWTLRHMQIELALQRGQGAGDA